MERNETIFGRFFVEAYRSDGADADRDGRVTLEGVLTQVALRNPHSEMRLEVQACAAPMCTAMLLWLKL